MGYVHFHLHYASFCLACNASVCKDVLFNDFISLLYLFPKLRFSGNHRVASWLGFQFLSVFFFFFSRIY